MAQKIRHLIYWSVVAVVFLPVMTLAILRSLYDVVEVGIDRGRSWAYRERYTFPYHGDPVNDDPRLCKVW